MNNFHDYSMGQNWFDTYQNIFSYGNSHAPLQLEQLYAVCEYLPENKNMFETVITILVSWYITTCISTGILWPIFIKIVLKTCQFSRITYSLNASFCGIIPPLYAHREIFPKSIKSN